MVLNYNGDREETIEAAMNKMISGHKGLFVLVSSRIRGPPYSRLKWLFRRWRHLDRPFWTAC